ncbi:heavy-metal-associated domain-containing protein [Gordonia sp. (in: high G+C Gram-positive bacteria)]|uniref:heavy-metal-associated domain-containing protein n=1 Tax=Gordonia sp. (in: high G+C Gram-positive bacteria) TaxID=84139 RepID=UPI003C718A43
MSETTTVTVTGMTCGHCAASVREEISEIPGVQQVDVDVDSGRVDITSDSPLDPAVVDAAVVEAGYQIQ